MDTLIIHLAQKYKLKLTLTFCRTHFGLRACVPRNAPAKLST